MLLSYTEAFQLSIELHRSSHRRCSRTKDVLIIVAKFTGKHLPQTLFFNKIASLRPATLLNERHWYRCFPMNFAKLLRTPILKNVCDRLLLFAGQKTTYKLNRRDLLLLPCLVHFNISVASSFLFFYLWFLCKYLFLAFKLNRKTENYTKYLGQF